MKYIYTLLFTCLLFYVHGQKNIDNVFQKQSINSISSVEVKSNLSTVPSTQLLNMTDSKGEEVFNTKGSFSLQIPLKSGSVEVELEVANIFSPNFRVMTPNGEVEVELPHYYHGKIKGDSKSFVALTITKDAIEGMITNEKLNLTIGRVMNTKEKLHVVYNTNELEVTPLQCFGAVEQPYDGDLPELQPNATNAAGCKAVEVYLEADNQTYLDWGESVQTVVNTMTGIFNNVSLMYDNEGINLVISTLFVWTTPDPFRTATNTTESLNLLTDYWIGQGSNFDGDLVQLVTTKSLGGGIANLLIGTSVFNGMTQRAVFSSCEKRFATGMSGGMVNSVINYPTYSSNVGLITHEIGHNFGLPHTHSCTWSNGVTTGAIDNCSATEGGCAGGPAPTNGGTVMSYCHLSGVGKPLTNGFGPLPSGKMNAEFNAATCLSGSKVPRPIVANQSICSSQSVQLTASGCTGTYQWFSVATGGTPISTTSTYTTPTLNASTSYYVSCTLNGCVSRRRKVDVTLSATIPPPTVQNTTACGSNASATLVGNCNGGAVINWYNALTGGTPIGTGNNFVLSNINANTTVYAGCSLAGCTASSRVALSITYQNICVYCQPTGLNCSFGDQITQVKIDNGATNLYTNNSTCTTGGYSLNTPATEVVLQQVQAYQLTTLNPATYIDGLSIWIDYNRNGTFEAEERIESYFTGATWTQRLTSFTVPIAATPGLTRIRFKVSDGLASAAPCSAVDGSSYGEIEDYVIRIAGGGTPCPPTLSHILGALPAGNYKAGQTITSQANISNSTTYQAGNHVLLNAGFQAGPNETFEAKIGGCNN